MRVSREQVSENRRQILSAAARLFRENGIAATGVDEIAERAGLTHGSVYSQFGSKDAVAAAAILFASAGSLRRWGRAAERAPGKPALREIVKGYLSRDHRDAPGHGCVLAALGPDAGRGPRATRNAFTRALRGAVDFIAGLMPDRVASKREERALALFSQMVGALILARAVDDEALSDRILRASSRHAIAVADHSPNR